MRRFGATLATPSLQPASTRLLQFLRVDLGRVKEKHLTDSYGEQVLVVCTYLDVRFKSHPCLLGNDQTQPRRALKEMALLHFANSPALREKVLARKEVPDHMTLSALAGEVARDREAQAKKRRRGAASDAKAEAASAAKGAAAAKCQRPSKRPLRREASADEFLFGGCAQKPSIRKQADDLASAVEDEILLWEKVPAAPSCDVSPFAWWREHGCFMPHLAEVARCVFGVPASSASLERTFSATGRAINARRPRLKTSQASSLIAGHANVAYGNCGMTVFEQRK